MASKMDRDYREKEHHKKPDPDEEESWISGEELITEESTDEDEEKSKTKSTKKSAIKFKGRSVPEKHSSQVTLPPINRGCSSSAGSIKSGFASNDITLTGDISEDQSPSWRPKRGSIKLSDLEGYQLMQLRESQIAEELNSSGVLYPEDDMCVVPEMNLEFLKDIDLKDLNAILKKYLDEDEIDNCDYFSDNTSCSQDARQFGGIYSDLMEKDASLNNLLVEMNSLDKILNEKTEAAEKFLYEGIPMATNRVKSGKSRKVCVGKARKIIRPHTMSAKGKKKISVLRMIKSADNDSKENPSDNQNQIKLTEDEMKRIEEILANEDHEGEEDIKLNPGEAYALSREDILTLESIERKLKALPNYLESIATGKLDFESDSAEWRKVQLCQEGQLLKEIDDKLELLQRDKNKNDKSLAEADVRRLISTLIPNGTEESEPENLKEFIDDSRPSSQFSDGNSCETDCDKQQAPSLSNLDTNWTD